MIICFLWDFFLIKEGDSEMDQKVQVLAAKSDDLCSSLGMPVVEGKN